MFANLIESGSHARDLKRKGSFFLGTLVFYSALVAAAGVGSIYAYNARLEDQQYEVIQMMRFPPAPARVEPETPNAPRPSGGNATQRLMTVKEASVITPYGDDKIASATTKEIKAGTLFRISNVISDAAPGGVIGPAGSFDHGRSGGSPGGQVVKIEGAEPPPIPKPSPTPQPAPRPKILKVSELLNGSAINKPVPPYPHIAKITRVSGVVAVQILIDEQGRVVSAQATSGHQLLRQAATQAAYRATFSPTSLNGQPVKVSGVITYNFVLQ